MVQLNSIFAASTLALPLVLAAPKPHSYEDNDTPLPLIVWHGLGDSYTGEGLLDVISLAEEMNPGLFTYAIRINEDPSLDQRATFLGNLTEQIDQVCRDLATHPIRSTAPAVDAMGFSQGGQFLRGYVERCNFPPVRNLLTFGSQHNGISAFQGCKPFDLVCKGAQLLLRAGTWTQAVQSKLVPAQYFRDPAQLEQYLEHSNFLADINNERVLKNKTYKENILKLENFVMYLFDEDTTVIPKETSWFGEIVEEQYVPLVNRSIYTEDWLGLKQLDEEEKLVFENINGGHMQIGDKVLKKAFTDYLGPETKKFPHHPKNGDGPGGPKPTNSSTSQGSTTHTLSPGPTDAPAKPAPLKPEPTEDKPKDPEGQVPLHV